METGDASVACCNFRCSLVSWYIDIFKLDYLYSLSLRVLSAMNDPQCMSWNQIYIWNVLSCSSLCVCMHVRE